MDNIIKYFEKFINWSKKDVKKCLESVDSNAGPPLVMILNGIDILGGMCYGFERGNSRDRSIRFMREKMAIPRDLAGFLYENVRCGMIHEGMPKKKIEFGSTESEQIFGINPSNSFIQLNVKRFANLYINTLNKIAAEPYKHIGHSPLSSTEEELESMFFNAKKAIEEKCKKDNNMYSTGNILDPQSSTSADLSSDSSSREN